MTLTQFLDQLQRTPNTISFDDSMAIISQYYDFTPTRFNNGDLINEADSNNGSCKLFAFAQLQSLTEQQTLHCFGDYYRLDVLQHPANEDHQNIRQFIKTGFSGLHYDGPALTQQTV